MSVLTERSNGKKTTLNTGSTVHGLGYLVDTKEDGQRTQCDCLSPTPTSVTSYHNRLYPQTISQNKPICPLVACVR